MALRAFLLFVTSFFCGPALADGAFLARLADNVGAPQAPRPAGVDAVAGVLLQGLSGQGGKATTFGHAFRKGDWPKGARLAALHRGRELPLQVDVKARHGDGSVRHAVLTLMNPRGANEAAIALHARADAEPPLPPLDPALVLARGYDLSVDFAFNGQRFSLDVAALARQALARAPDYWLRGSLAAEFRIQRKLLPQITAIVDIRLTADGAVRSAISLHNDDLHETNNLDIPYSYALTMAGRSVVQRSVTHRRYANWREIVWAGAAPSSAHVVYDYPYMIAAGATPAYDPELPLAPAFAEKLFQRHAQADNGPFGASIITKAMPTTGGRADIGMVPDWTLAWLRLQTPAARAVMMDASTAAGAVPWHLRDPGTGRAPRLDDHPRLWMDYRASQGANGHGPIKTKVDGWKLDNAHQPDLNYIPYLISGDRWRLDELHAQLAFGLLSYNPEFRSGAEGNLRFDEVRGQAWVNRTHAYAAWITPDDHPDKGYITDKLKNRLSWYARKYPADDTLGGPAAFETSGWIMGQNPKGIISNWQQDFFAQSLAQAGRMDMREAASVYGYTRKYMLSRFLRFDFDPRWSTAYHIIHGDRETRAPFRTWREIAQANIADGRFEAKPTQMMGGPDKPWNFAAQARAGYAAMLGAFRDPLVAEAYALIVRDSLAMNPGFAEQPKWAIAPVFSDGTTLPIARHYAIDGRRDGGPGNELFAGGAGSDTLLGGGGSDIVAGFGGDDVIAGGDGVNFLAGGAGRDRIVIEGGLTYAAGGPGADVFMIGRLALGGPAGATRAEIVDFKPGVDRLDFAPALGDPRALLLGARATRTGALISFPKGVLLLRGIEPSLLREDSLAMR